MAVNKDSKNCKNNRPELDDYRTQTFKIVISKRYTISKDANVILIVMQPPKTSS